MNVLFVNNHCLSDPTAGVTQSFRTILKWWQDGGHLINVATTARFESPVPWTIEEHLASFNPSPTVLGGVGYMFDGLAVGLFPTIEEQFAQHVAILDAVMPDVVVVQGSHPLLRRWLAAARAREITTVLTVRSYRYYDPSFYADVDHVFTPSMFLQRHYEEKIQRTFDVLAPPLDWAKVRAASWDPKFITFIQPRKHKGWNAILRLAQMLQARRPDIPPMRVITSGYGIGPDQIWLPNGMASGIEFVPPTATPAEWCAWTKILLAPSVWDEPWGRVAAEAMVNGIMPIVSDRGALSEVVGDAGIVLSLPDWLLPASGRLPTKDEMQEWFEVICGLWDAPDGYTRQSDLCAAYAAAHFSEAASRQQYLDYLTKVGSTS